MSACEASPTHLAHLRSRRDIVHMTRESRFVLSFPKHIYWTVMFGVTVILIACVTFPAVVMLLWVLL